MAIFSHFSPVNCIWRPRRDAYISQMGPKPKKSDSWPSKTAYTWEKCELWRKMVISNDFYFAIFCYIKKFWVGVTKNEIPKLGYFSTPTCNIPKCSSAQARKKYGRGFLKFFVFCRFLIFASLGNQKIFIFGPWEVKKNRKIDFFKKNSTLWSYTGKNLTFFLWSKKITKK